MLNFPDANLLNRLAPALGCLLTVGTVPLLAVAIGRLTLLRSPATRHAVLLSGLLLVLASPLMTLGLQQAAIAIVAVPIPARAMALQRTAESVEAIPPQFIPGGAIKESWGATTPEPVTHPKSTATSTVSPSSSVSRFAWLARLSELPLWVRVGGILWGLGSFALACDVLRCWRVIRRLRMTAQATGAEGLILPSHVRMAEGDVPVPMVTGVWGPMILFPRGLLAFLTTDQLQDILTHELAHVYRRDNLVLWFEAAARVLFWPIVTLHVLLHDLSQAREDACDNAVLAHRDPVAYSETLLAIAQRCVPHRPLRLTSDAFRRRESLVGRVTRIIDQRRNLATRPFWSAVALSGAILVLFGIPLCGLAFVPDENKSPDVPKSAGKIVATKTTVATVAFANENTGATRQPAEAAATTATEEFLKRVQQTQRGPFGGNPIQKDQDGQIISLGLGEFKLMPGDAKTIAAMLHLVSLDLRRSNVSDADLQELSGLTKLQRLNLWDAKITDAGIAHVTRMKSLKSLELGGTGLTDLGLPEVAKLPELVYLDLARTKITDAGLGSLGALTRLAGLKLSETSISDTGLVLLEKFASLKGVTLDETKVSTAGIARFAEREAFQWMATDDGVANELARRQSAGDTEGCNAMLSIGLDLPHTGKFKTRSVTAHPVTETDTERQRRRYRVEWDWENRGKHEGLFAELSIRQGTARVYEAGLLE